MQDIRKRASVATLGCRLNQSESSLIEDRLAQEGYAVVPFGDPADLGIINTCTVTREADAKCRQLIRGFVRKNPHAYTAVIGCYSQMASAALAEIEGVDLIVGNQEKLNVLDYIDGKKNGAALIVRDRITRDDFAIEACGSSPLDKRANLKIQDGCSFMCSFCIISFARGRARSRALPNVLDEARQLVDRGAKEVVLTGVNLGTYDYDGANIADVVDALHDIPGLARIRISSIEPTTIPDRLIEAMAAPDHALVPYLHIPLQSGSDRVLKLMKRRYVSAEIQAFIEDAHARVEGLCIGTDVMVGMPGETDDDFAATADLLWNSPIAYAHVFKYSERDGTPAARMPNKVDPRVMSRRSAVIRRLSAQKRNAFHDSQRGRVLPVLFEEVEDGHWLGYTGNYIRVAVRSDRTLKNELRPVRLMKPAGELMMGELDDRHEG